jgi:hypothetical protein
MEINLNIYGAQYTTCWSCKETTQIGIFYEGSDGMTRCLNCQGYVYEGQYKTIMKRQARAKKAIQWIKDNGTTQLPKNKKEKTS